MVLIIYKTYSQCHYRMVLYPLGMFLFLISIHFKTQNLKMMFMLFKKYSYQYLLFFLQNITLQVQ